MVDQLDKHLPFSTKDGQVEISVTQLNTPLHTLSLLETVIKSVSTSTSENLLRFQRNI
jgi:hypothetical protein